jgi:hypothetical protein
MLEALMLVHVAQMHELPIFLCSKRFEYNPEQ